MEKYSYEEAREWFWVRTLIWFFPAALASAMGHFYAAKHITVIDPRLWIAVGVGVGVVLLAILAAFLSMQFPWMRAGKWYGFALTGPLCAAISAFITFVIFGLVLAFIQDKTTDPVSPVLIDNLYSMSWFIISAAGFWGFCFGSWFALRRDRYFVEQI